MPWRGGIMSMAILVLAHLQRADPSTTTATKLCPNNWICDGSPEAHPFDSLGFHRYRVQLASYHANNPNGCVHVRIPWRRRATPPLSSPVAVRDTNGYTLSFMEVNRTVEMLELLISRQPLTSSTASDRHSPFAMEALVYVLPFTFIVDPYKYGDGMKAVAYLQKSGSSKEPNRNWAAGSNCTTAPMPTYEGRNIFSAFTRMELAATEDETLELVDHYSDAIALVWHEPRESTIRMRDKIPFAWTTRPPVAILVHSGHDSSIWTDVVELGVAKRGEHFMFQLGLFSLNQRFDVQMSSAGLHSQSGAVIDALSSPALGGMDSFGKPFNRSFSVDAKGVGVLWVAVDVPTSAVPGEYHGSVTIIAKIDGRVAQATINVALTVDHTEPVAEGGDFQPLDTLNRARWLDSTAGQSHVPAARFQPLLHSADGLISSNAEIKLDNVGLPASVLSKGDSEHNLLHAPLQFVAVDEKNVAHRFSANTSSIRWSTASTGDVVAWQAQARVDALSLSLALRAKMHAHGALDFSVNISNVGTEAVALLNLFLVLPFREASVPFSMGLGKTGGRRPLRWEWRWLCAQGHDQGNHMVWLGDPFLGMRLKLKGDDPSWNSGLKVVGKEDVPTSWGGLIQSAQCICAPAHCNLTKCNLTTFRGGVNISAANDGVVAVSAFSGARTLQTRASVVFNFELLLTPAQPFSPRSRFAQRYSQQGGAMPLDTPNMTKLINQLVQTGVTTFNIHQGANILPYIDYVTASELVPPLSEYARLIHARNGTLKLYFTTRELSNHVDIMWVLRSLGGEIIDLSPHADDQDPSQLGYAWLQEHLGSGYESCYATKFLPSPWNPDPDGIDAAICDVDTGTEQQTLRWNNYYVRSLQFMMENPPYIDGLYLDGIAFDSHTMNRVRKVMDESLATRPGARLIDMHSGNLFAEAANSSYYPDYAFPAVLNHTCATGCVSAALCYMQNMPFMDSTMIGEAYNYDNTPADYWLIEISSLAWGLGNDMLHNGNPWRGMVFGMVTRYGLDTPTDPSNKTQMWQLWDEFGLGGAEMVGWWHRSPLSHVTAHDSTSNCSEVYSTTYLRHGERALVALGSWQSAKATQNCSLQMQWDRLGFHATSMQVPGIDGFQAANKIAVGSSIQIPYQQGAIVLLHDNKNTR